MEIGTSHTLCDRRIVLRGALEDQPLNAVLLVRGFGLVTYGEATESARGVKAFSPSFNPHSDQVDFSVEATWEGISLVNDYELEVANALASLAEAVKQTRDGSRDSSHFRVFNVLDLYIEGEDALAYYGDAAGRAPRLKGRYGPREILEAIGDHPYQCAFSASLAIRSKRHSVVLFVQELWDSLCPVFVRYGLIDKPGQQPP